MFLTCSLPGVYSHPSHLNWRERYLGRFERGGGSGACGRGGRALRTREALGNRPCPLRGAAFNGWTRRVKGGETRLDGELARARARKNRSQGQKSPRRNVERRCRVPLIPGDPGIKPRLLPRCAFRRSASLFSFQGRFTEPTIHAKIFAGDDDARPARRSNPLTAESANSTLRPTRKNAAAVRKP